MFEAFPLICFNCFWQALLTGMLRGPTLLLGIVADMALLDLAALPKHSLGKSASLLQKLVFSPDDTLPYIALDLSQRVGG